MSTIVDTVWIDRASDGSCSYSAHVCCPGRVIPKKMACDNAPAESDEGKTGYSGLSCTSP